MKAALVIVLAIVSSGQLAAQWLDNRRPGFHARLTASRI